MARIDNTSFEIVRERAEDEFRSFLDKVAFHTIDGGQIDKMSAMLHFNTAFDRIEKIYARDIESLKCEIEKLRVENAEMRLVIRKIAESAEVPESKRSKYAKTAEFEK